MVCCCLFIFDFCCFRVDLQCIHSTKTEIGKNNSQQLPQFTSFNFWNRITRITTYWHIMFFVFAMVGTIAPCQWGVHGQGPSVTANPQHSAQGITPAAASALAIFTFYARKIFHLQHILDNSIFTDRHMISQFELNIGELCITYYTLICPEDQHIKFDSFHIEHSWSIYGWSIVYEHPGSFRNKWKWSVQF